MANSFRSQKPNLVNVNWYQYQLALWDPPTQWQHVSYLPPNAIDPQFCAIILLLLFPPMALETAQPP